MSEPPPIPESVPARAVPLPPPEELWAKPGWRLHPLSGVLTIFIDNVFFGVEVFSLELALPLSCLLAFTITTFGVYRIQRRLYRDLRWVAVLKALVAGILAGAPTSISGTVFGAAVLLSAGLAPGKGMMHLAKSTGTALMKTGETPALTGGTSAPPPTTPERR